MKKIVGSIAVGFLLVGCGGAMPDAADATGNGPKVTSSSQALCEGFSNGATWCTAKCGGNWYYVGQYPGIGYGQCGAAADSFCRYWFGVGASGSCWSY